MTADLFTFARVEAMAAKESGIALAERNAPVGFKADAYDAILTVARLRPTFTADDVWDWLEIHHEIDEDVNHAALGPVMRRAANAGEIKKTGRLVPTRQAQRHRDLVEWERA